MPHPSEPTHQITLVYLARAHDDAELSDLIRERLIPDGLEPNIVSVTPLTPLTMYLSPATPTQFAR